MSYRVRDLRPAEVAEIAGWRYPDEDAVYDLRVPPDPAAGYFAVEDGEGDVVGYCCFGAEARVPGVEAEPGVVDVGYGMRPDLVGQGRGRPFLAAILAFAGDRYAPERFRALVLDWNHRSLAVCRRAGFEPVGEVATDHGRFVVLEQPA